MSAPAATAPSTSALADGLAPIGLAEAVATAPLLERLDRKYVVPIDLLPPLAAALRSSHRALVIDGRSAFAYRTRYFDTPELASYRDHLQGRRRRFKCRVRHYVDAGDHWFEVKLRGSRGRTDKVRARCGPLGGGPLPGAQLEVLRGALARDGRPAPPLLRPSLAMEYRRTTLVAPALGERLTCDVGLRFEGGGRLREGLAIVESKSARGRGAADHALVALGARPVASCSKYCLGIALAVAGVRDNPLRPVLRRYFES
jgi:hypothetical protein